MFYAAALSDIRSKVPMRYALSVCSVFFIICTTIALMLNDPGSTEHTKDIVRIMYFVYGAFLDFILAAALGYFGWQFSLKQTSQRTVATRLLPRSPMMFQNVNWLLVLMSTLRGVLSIIMSTGRGAYLDELPHLGHDHDDTPYLLIIYFIAVEILPAVCIFITLWKRASLPSKLLDSSANTISDRNANNSVDDQRVIVRFTNQSRASESSRTLRSPSGATIQRRAPPAWWSNFIESMMYDENGGNVADGPPLSDLASDDDYMMFKGVIVKPGSATGDAIQIADTRREGGVGSLLYLEGQQNVATPWNHAPGHQNYAVNQNIFSGSPLAASGSPPSFEAWTKATDTKSHDSYDQNNTPTLMMPSAVNHNANGLAIALPGSPLVTTPYAFAGNGEESMVNPALHPSFFASTPFRSPAAVASSAGSINSDNNFSFGRGVDISNSYPDGRGLNSPTTGQYNAETTSAFFTQENSNRPAFGDEVRVAFILSFSTKINANIACRRIYHNWKKRSVQEIFC